MSKDDFIDLLDFSAEEEDSENEGTLETIIKNDALEVDDGTMLVSEHKVIESEAFKLRLFKKEDYIDSIEIECSCGKVAKIHLDYDSGGSLTDDSVSAAAQKMSHTHSDDSAQVQGGDEFEDDDTFHGGIAADSISPDGDTKIIGTEDDDQEDPAE